MFENQSIAHFERAIDGRKLFVFGASAAAKKALLFCRKHQYSVQAVADNDSAKWGSVFCGYPVVNPAKLLAYNRDEVVVLIASVYLTEIAGQLEETGITNLFSAHLCNMIESRRLSPINDEDMVSVEELKQLVSDDLSRMTVDRIVELRNQGSNRLYEVFAGRQYFQRDILTFGEETFLDCGCYRGEEIDYLNRLGTGRHRIYAFEPDTVNYRVIEKKYRDMPNVVCMNFAVWNSDCELSFCNTGTDGSMITDDGNGQVHAVKIDDVIDERVTFIKMDIEGAETEAIDGAGRIIREYKPKLAICIYHKDRDLWELPLKIRSMVPEYDIYIRQHSLGLSDTVMYAVCR